MPDPSEAVVGTSSSELERIESAEAALLARPDLIDVPLRHHLAEVKGVYMREAFFPADTFAIGHKHKTRHYNILLTGRIRVKQGDKVEEIVAPAIWVGEPGVRKVAYIVEDTRWINVLGAAPQTLEELEAALIEKSETFKEHESLRLEAGQLRHPLSS